MKTYTTGDIAKYCDVNLRTVIRWIEKGELNGFKLPGRGNNRVTPDELVRFMTRFGIPLPPELERYLSEQKVLIVDDEQAVARSISRVLKRAGYDTFMATDGFSAGAQLVREKPALMTLDLNMPGMSGEEVIGFVKSLDELRHTKILVISSASECQLQAAIDTGANAYLQKPFDNAELTTEIKRLLSNSQ